VLRKRRERWDNPGKRTANLRPRRLIASPGYAGASSPGSYEAAAPFPGASRTGRPTKSSSRKFCCRGLPRPGLRGPIQGLWIATHRGPPSRKRLRKSSRTPSGPSDSGGKRRWHSSSSRWRSRGVEASYPARERSWKVCPVSAPILRARCWPSCMGESSRSWMSTWLAS
jgi:hypothetical protein